MTPDARPVAAPDALTAPWWDATREGRLLVQRCAACGHHQHHPRHVCTACGTTDLAYVEVSGRGVVHSFSVVHRAPQPGFTPPYVVALVRLDEGPTLLTNLVGLDHDALRCELAVRLDWLPLPDGRQLPIFRPAN
jgi:uncharacterized protein